MKKLFIIPILLTLFITPILSGCETTPNANISYGCSSYNLQLNTTNEKFKIKSTSLLFEYINFYENDKSLYIFYSGQPNDQTFTNSKSMTLRGSHVRSIPANTGKLKIDIGMYLTSYTTNVTMNFSKQNIIVYTKIADGGIIKLYEDPSCKKEKIISIDYSGDINGNKIETTVSYSITINYTQPVNNQGG